MQVTYYTTLGDYFHLTNIRLKNLYLKRIGVLAIISILGGIFSIDHGQFNTSRVITGFLIVTLTIALILYAFLFLTDLSNADIGHEKVLSVTDDGLSIIDKYNNTTRLIKWFSILSATSNTAIIHFQLSDNTDYYIPLKYIAWEEEQAMIETIQYHLENVPEWKLRVETLKLQNKPNYWLGLLCLIPLIGAFAGIFLAATGIVKYKDIKLVLIGVAGIAFTVILYSSLFLWSKSTDARQNFIPVSQGGLNTLVKEIEFYKVEHNHYPDSLRQVIGKDELVSINDPLQENFSQYYYKKEGNKYYLFSNGLDGKSFTKDDIYPEISNQDSTHIGILIPSSVFSQKR